MEAKENDYKKNTLLELLLEHKREELDVSNYSIFGYNMGKYLELNFFYRYIFLFVYCFIVYCSLSFRFSPTHVSSADIQTKRKTSDNYRFRLVYVHLLLLYKSV